MSSEEYQLTEEVSSLKFSSSGTYMIKFLIMSSKRLLRSLNKGKPRWMPLPKHWNRKFHSAFSLQELVEIYKVTQNDEGEEFNQDFYERQWRQNCLEAYVASHPLTESEVKKKQEHYNERDAEYWTRAKLNTDHLQRFQDRLKYLFHESNRTQAKLQHDLNA